MQIKSKLPKSDTSIFTVMSELARQHDAINLGQGFPDFDCEESLKALVAIKIKEAKHQYAPMPGVLGLRQAIAQKINAMYGATINPVSYTHLTLPTKA